MEYNIVIFFGPECNYSETELKKLFRSKSNFPKKISKMNIEGCIDIKYMLYAIDQGADGVIIIKSIYNMGTFNMISASVQKDVELANHILERRGFGNQRINMYWCKSGDYKHLAEVIEDTYRKIKEIGPNPIKCKIDKYITPIVE